MIIWIFRSVENNKKKYKIIFPTLTLNVLLPNRNQKHMENNPTIPIQCRQILIRLTFTFDL